MSTAGSLLRSFSNAIARVVRGIENRRAAKALMHLDARGLADIGLSRGAVESAFANTSPFEDPTPQLSRIAARRGSGLPARESAPSPARERDTLWTGTLPSAGSVAVP
ncbi:MAG: DUF1127 domain-containing protein [Proteobacteria bacterium]|nr:DUF1127 domain-containing protein [Pseudomonadota bacterium]